MALWGSMTKIAGSGAGSVPKCHESATLYFLTQMWVSGSTSHRKWSYSRSLTFAGCTEIEKSRRFLNLKELACIYLYFFLKRQHFLLIFTSLWGILPIFLLTHRSEDPGTKNSLHGFPKKAPTLISQIKNKSNIKHKDRCNKFGLEEKRQQDVPLVHKLVVSGQHVQIFTLAGRNDRSRTRQAGRGGGEGEGGAQIAAWVCSKNRSKNVFLCGQNCGTMEQTAGWEMKLAAKKEGVQSKGQKKLNNWRWLAVLRIRDVYPGSRIQIFTHPGSRIQKQQQKRGAKKNFVVIPFL